ncbi:MAG: tetratricopeptide repeat protein, partial [Candidatus Heimdallarchaeota archaeon]
ALDDFAFILEKEPENPEFHFHQAICFLFKEDFEDAAQGFSHAMEIDPKGSNLFLYHFYRGNAYYYAKSYENALSDFTQTIRWNPGDAQALLNRGNCYMALEDPDKALADYSAALEINPEYQYALRNRASIYLAKNMLELAIVDLEKLDSLTIQKNSIDQRDLAHSYLDLSEHYRKENDADRWIEYWQKYLEFTLKCFPDNPGIHFHYARHLAILNRYEESERMLQKAITLDANYRGRAKKDPILSKMLEMGSPSRDGPRPRSAVLPTEKREISDIEDIFSEVMPRPIEEGKATSGESNMTEFLVIIVVIIILSIFRALFFSS